MSKYIVSSLSKYSEYDNEIPRVNKVISFNKKPTFEEAHAEFKEFAYFDENEWSKIDGETWETYIDSDYYEYGDPICYQIKIQTPKQHKEMVDNWIEYIKLNTAPKEAVNATN
nr:MAG TPA: hypothetical protein [Caudoviricetes sp.]